MKNTTIITSIFSFLLLISSCNKDLDLDDYVKDYTNKTKIVIEAQISTKPKKYHVIITKPANNINQPKSIEGVSGAKVTITDGINTWNFSELPKNHKKYEDFESPFTAKFNSGIYESDEYFAGKENKSYTLSVVSNGKTYTATSTMPISDNLTQKEFEILKNATERISDIFNTEKSAIFDVNLLNRDAIKIALAGRVNFHDRIAIDNISTNGNSSHILDNKLLHRYTMNNAYKKYVWSVLSKFRAKGINNYTAYHLPSNFNSEEVAGYFSTVSSKEYNISSSSFSARNLNIFNSNKQYKANYIGKGEVKIYFKSTGACELHNGGDVLYGAYEIENNHKVLAYFSNQFNAIDTSLYHFYEVNLKQAIVITPPPAPIPVYRSEEHCIFTIKNQQSIQSKDAILWTEF